MIEGIIASYFDINSLSEEKIGIFLLRFQIEMMHLVEAYYLYLSKSQYSKQYTLLIKIRLSALGLTFIVLRSKSLKIKRLNITASTF